MLDRDRKAGLIKRAPPHYIRKHAVCDHEGRSVLPTKILLRILLACLVRVITMALRDNVHTGTTRTYLCRFANLLSDDFPLVGVVLFDGGKQRSALLTHQHALTKVSQALITHFVFSELGVVHILYVSVRNRAVKQHRLNAYLIPMLLYASFSSLWERLPRDKSINSTSTHLKKMPWQMGTMPTFAISLQLFPVSLICFSLSSSAGVQGVFVRLFLVFGSWAASTSAGGGIAPLLACASALLPAELAICSCDWPRVTDLRFRFVGDGSGCWAPAWES
jgi:hypothetical protein